MRDITNIFKIKNKRKTLDYFIIGKTSYIIVKSEETLNLKDYYLFYKLSLLFNSIIILIDDEEELYDSLFGDFCDLIICIMICKVI